MDRIKDKNYSNFSHLSNEDKSIEAHIAANHGKRCSCPACGNPRRNPWAKKREQQTLQERRMSEYEEEDE